MNRLSADRLGLIDRITNTNWLFILLVCVLSALGLAALYSAAGGALDPWAKNHIIRFFACCVVMMVIAVMDIRWVFALSIWAWLGCLGLLIVVAILGRVGMGAQRWIDLGFMNLQPSELMKIACVMLLARYYQTLPAERVNRLASLGIAVAILLLPGLLVLAQPDLGTTIMLVTAGLAVIFLAGLSWKIVGAGVVGMAAFIPVAWHFVMEPYQKDRVLTFLDPSRDPLGSGYHITQSKIAIGSGGVSGKGYLQGSQSHLDFLPEKQTDFIFTLWVEEWGLLGGLFVIGLCGAIMAYAFAIAMRVRHVFGRLLVLGLMVNFALYVFINIGMVMGLLPVVGAPLPLVSYGGSAMLSAMICFGLILNADINRNATLPKP